MIKGRRAHFIFFLSFIFIFSFSQINLVTNSSFETYTNCPSGSGQINYAPNWYSPTTGSPDYFNSCFSFTMAWSTNVDVPNNLLGYQNAKTGNGYSGISCFYKYSQTYREYLQTTISSPLIMNQKYFVTVYLSLSDSSRYATDDFGIYVSQLPVSRPDFDAFGYAPQVSNLSGNYLNDKNNWIKLSGSFIASGNEQYITIGNFKNDLNTDTVRLIPQLSSNPDYNSAYYYIEDVCLSDDSLTCNYVTGIQSMEVGNENFYYSFETKTLVLKENGRYQIEMMNIFGGLLQVNNPEGKKYVDLSNQPSGYYTLIITNAGRVYRKKIIIN